MALPTRPLPTSEVAVNGELVSFRSLSMSEASLFSTFRTDGGEVDAPAAAAFAIEKACDLQPGEATTWLETTAFDEAQRLVNAILVLSGLVATTEDGQPDDPKTVYERAFLTGDLSADAFYIARMLGKDVDERGAIVGMSNATFHQWRAYIVYEAAMQEQAHRDRPQWSKRR